MILREQKADLWIGTGLLLLCGFAGWRATYIKQGFNSSAAGPSFMPWLVIALIALLSVLLIVRALRAEHDPQTDIVMPGKRTLAAMAGFTLLMICYAVAFMPVGYLPSTLVAFIVGLILLGERNWLLVVLFPVGMTLAIYFGFTELLSVWLP
ncbi:tripartite tricarboxylate transporter TctB family protein [Alloyangia pacifica]|uniref:Putative tricarboxylic transport membrane protein n=1 Tax=Alloyangia pacifica TaxID=311180 RepID=A0A1I6WE33_9RHOB|nr:tripartite tricarboxylate transporter TctB family protein [Alloyangia pacifica]SDI59272.1 putative tricarboxylic transport membrane protein [Alloyangia pacifica]SFT23814.1 putative tricarboxylic transport membrane protein [Alloyangia pacifica]